MASINGHVTSLFAFSSSANILLLRVTSSTSAVPFFRTPTLVCLQSMSMPMLASAVALVVVFLHLWQTGNQAIPVACIPLSPGPPSPFHDCGVRWGSWLGVCLFPLLVLTVFVVSQFSFALRSVCFLLWTYRCPLPSWSFCHGRCELSRRCWRKCVCVRRLPRSVSPPVNRFFSSFQASLRVLPAFSFSACVGSGTPYFLKNLSVCCCSLLRVLTCCCSCSVPSTMFASAAWF